VHRVTLEVDAEGRLRRESYPRWGGPDDARHREHAFGVVFEGEAVFGGYTIPSALRAGWWFATERWPEGEFFRATIDGARFR
jgi:hypothetical protein